MLLLVTAGCATLQQVVALRQVDFALDRVANDVEVRLVQLDWTLLVEDRETVSGIFEDEVVFRPGDVAVFPMRIELDLAGQGGEPRNVALEAIPTVGGPR